MNYLSFCSGIEAATVAWHDLGFNPIGFSEIEPFPSEVLKHHYPHVPNYGDMTNYEQWNINENIDIIVGGTPCQAFSIAGLRQGFSDERGNLTLTYLKAIDRFKPRWVVWENVPGVLSHDGGRTFGVFLGALAKLGYGFAYRILDAQYFGVPQRRRRIFLVAHIRDWRKAAKVLVESESVCRDTESSSETQQEATAITESSTGKTSFGYRKGGYGQFVEDESLGPLCHHEHKETSQIVLQGVAATEHTISDKIMSVTASYGQGGADLATKPLVLQQCYTLSSHAQYKEGIGTLRAHGGDVGGGSETLVLMDQGGSVMSVMYDKVGTLRRESHGHEPIVLHGTQDPITNNDCAFPLGRNNGAENTIFALAENIIGRQPQNGGNGNGFAENVMYTLNATGVHGVVGDNGAVVDKTGTLTCGHGERGVCFDSIASGICALHGEIPIPRKLTPIECERLQGFPDDYTNIEFKGKPVTDNHRYKALGNSMAVPVMRWIGERIKAVDNDR